MREFIEANGLGIWILIGLAVVALAIVVGVAIVLSRRSKERTEMLRARFGPEYGRAMRAHGSRGERELEARVQRVDDMRFRELSDTDRVRFTSRWNAIQAQFVDDPRAAVARANELIKEVMSARGYTTDAAFEQRAADLSVDHPEVVQHYRAAHSLARSGSHERMNTEDLRQAVVHYRVLFADLLRPAQTAPAGAPLRPAHA